MEFIMAFYHRNSLTCPKCKKESKKLVPCFPASHGELHYGSLVGCSNCDTLWEFKAELLVPIKEEEKIKKRNLGPITEN